jgi:LacI family transcriptional regulator
MPPVSTYKEIADQAGVSIGTVYRVLHQRGRYSPRTAERVNRVARELGYTRNIYASNLSRSRTYRIAVVIPEPSHDNSYWAQPHQGIAAAVSGLQHYRVERIDVFYDEHDPSSFAASLHAVLAAQPDAMVVAPSVAADREQILAEARVTVPHVVIDTPAPSPHSLGFVGQDSFSSGRAAGRLLDLLTPPDARVVSVRSVPASRHIDRRLGGVRAHLVTAREAAPQEIDVDFANPPSGLERLRELVGGSSPPQAYFISNSNASRFADMLAEVSDEMGKRGNHAAIVGYDLVPANVEALREGRIAFLLSQRPLEQGRVAVEKLFRTVVLGEAVCGDYAVPIDIVSPETIDSHVRGSLHEERLEL